MRSFRPVEETLRTTAQISEEPGGGRITWWLMPLLITLFFTIVLNVWVFYAELSTGGANLAGGNPPVPVLLMMSLLVPFRRFLRLTERQLLVTYLLSTFALIPTMYGGARAFFPSLTTPFYYASLENRLKEFWALIPEWWLPKDPAIVRGFFQGGEERVPWSDWMKPLFRWSLFFLALWALATGLSFLLTPSWLVRERLNFPLAQLPLQMVTGVNGRPFFSSRLIWWGLSVGMIPTGLMILLSLFREVHRAWDWSPYLQDRPWNALRPILVYPLVEGVGFGFLVQQEVLFSIWFFYFLLKMMALVGVGFFGWQIPQIMHVGDSFPFPHSQSVGGYLALAVLLVTQWYRQKGPNFDRWVVALVVFSSLFIFLWFLRSGMSVVIALTYLSVLSLFAITYARVRAEAGMPYTWVYPYGAPRDFLLYSFGITGLLQFGGVRSLVLLSAFFWLARHYYLFLNAAYSADAVKLSSEVDLSFGSVTLSSLLSVLIGVWAAFVSHLIAYYKRGANFLEGVPGTGDYRTYLAALDYRLLSKNLDKPEGPDLWRIGATLYGGIVTLIVFALRRIVATFPLHPLGFPVAYAYSHHCPYWFPTFFVWSLKGLLMRYGGIGIFRRWIPFFLGLTLGHYIIAGIVWAGILSPLFKGRWPYPFRLAFE
ncbi:MAG: hypothetical protein NZ959_06185 [Armatimonadetes bacterium]|nr:hypothetical protein [Armatimonadota bacterium]MDW8121632.1 DUF6785 family protein [Armatimonadota bacterium]